MTWVVDLFNGSMSIYDYNLVYLGQEEVSSGFLALKVHESSICCLLGFSIFRRERLESENTAVESGSKMCSGGERNEIAWPLLYK